MYVNLLLRRPVWDEALYHLPELGRYSPGLPGLATLREAGTAVGPLFYVLFANLPRPLADDLTALRLIVLACAAGCLWAFGRIARESGAVAGPAVLLLATFPYFLTLSGIFMSEIPSLLAGLAAYCAYLRWRERRRAGPLLGYLACAGLAVLLRQYFVFLPLGLAAHELIFGGRRRSQGLLLALPALLLLVSLMLWNGLVPPVLQDRHLPGLSLTGLTSFLVWTGVYGLPWLWLRARRTAPGAWLLLALLAVPLAAAAPEPGAGVVSALFGLLPGPALPVLVGVAAALGGAVCIVLARELCRVNPAARAATMAFFAFGLVLAFSGPLVYERYFLPGLPLLLAGFGPDIRLLPALGWSLLVQLPLAVCQLLRLAGK